MEVQLTVHAVYILYQDYSKIQVILCYSINIAKTFCEGIIWKRKIMYIKRK